MRTAFRTVPVIFILCCGLLAGCAARQDPELAKLQTAQEELRVQVAEMQRASDLLASRLGQEMAGLREQLALLMETVRQTLAVLEGGVRADAERLGKAAREAAVQNLRELLRSSTLLLEKLNKELGSMGKGAQPAP